MHLYLTHPQVRIDPAVPVPRWGLSSEGRARTAALCKVDWIRRFGRIVSSEETKAVEAAEMLGQALALDVETFPDLHENDRSATGFLPREDFETVADAFFSQPEVSVLGWETAQAAQTRIVAGVRGAVAGSPGTPAIFVGHGAVGTLLKCTLARRPISRREDQPDGGGNHIGFTLGPDQVLHDWQPMEQAPL